MVCSVALLLINVIITSQYIIRSPSQLFYCAHEFQPCYARRKLITLPRSKNRHTRRPTLNTCAPHKDQQQYRDSGDATADHRGPPRVHQTISTAEDHLDAEIGSLTESTETSRQTTQHAAAQLLLEAHSGQIQWISAYESRAPESGQMSMPMGGTIEHRSTPNSEQSTQPSTAPRCEL